MLSKKRNALPLVVWSFVVLNGETVCHAADLEDPPPDFWLNLKSDPIAFALSRLISEFSLFDFELDWFFFGVSQADLGSGQPIHPFNPPDLGSDQTDLNRTACEPRVETVGKRPRAEKRPNSDTPRVPDLRQVCREWHTEEKEILQKLHKQCGPDWTEISKGMEVAGYYRDAKQCQRQVIALDPNTRYNRWSTIEDQTLQEFHNELGPKWMEISKRMKAIGYHRNNRQCKGRIRALRDWVRTGA
jgi:hypothetical protein